MLNEILLFRAMIDNAIDCSLNMKDPGLQQEEIDWFYTDNYSIMHKLCWGNNGRSLREKLEVLWADIELHPEMATKYRRIFNPMGGDAEVRKRVGMMQKGKKQNGKKRSARP